MRLKKVKEALFELSIYIHMFEQHILIVIFLFINDVYVREFLENLFGNALCGIFFNLYMPLDG